MAAIRTSSSASSRSSVTNERPLGRRAQPVGPFDDADRPVERVEQAELDQLAGAAEPVEVGVPELDRRRGRRPGRGCSSATGPARRARRAARRAPISARAKTLLPAPRPPTSPTRSPAPKPRRDRAREALGVALAAKRQGRGQVGSVRRACSRRFYSPRTRAQAPRSAVACGRRLGRRLGELRGQDEGPAGLGDPQLAAGRLDDAAGEPEADAVEPVARPARRRRWRSAA